MKEIPFFTPPLSEQSAIVRFLNHADRRIRRYIRAKQKLIKLLEEQKHAIIHRAVTRGLDPTVRLKPSGVAWLGDVPEHWEVRKLRQCVSITGGMTPSMENPSFWDGTIPWVTPKDMKQEAIGDSSIKVSEAAIRGTSLRLINPPAILMVVRGMILARKVPIAWTTAPVTVNQDMKALKPIQGLNAEFLAQWLNSAQSAFVPLIDEAGHGTRRLPTERWRGLAVAVPPEEEQSIIVHFLSEAANKAMNAIEHAHREISLLREYRIRLIADVVTGKLDVREAAAKLPSETDEADSLDEADTPVEDAENVEDTAEVEA
jgi:type I restriction enzyme S subunit